MLFDFLLGNNKKTQIQQAVYDQINADVYFFDNPHYKDNKLSLFWCKSFNAKVLKEITFLYSLKGHHQELGMCGLVIKTWKSLVNVFKSESSSGGSHGGDRANSGQKRSFLERKNYKNAFLWKIQISSKICACASLDSAPFNLYIIMLVFPFLNQ